MTKPRPGEERGFVVEQLAFEDVVDMEPIPGDPEYTAWIMAGRPNLDVRHAEEASHPELPQEPQ